MDDDGTCKKKLLLQTLDMQIPRSLKTTREEKEKSTKRRPLTAMVDGAQDIKAEVGIKGVHGHLNQRQEEQLRRGDPAQHGSERDESCSTRKVTIQQTEERKRTRRRRGRKRQGEETGSGEDECSGVETGV